MVIFSQIHFFVNSHSTCIVRNVELHNVQEKDSKATLMEA